MNRLCLVLVGLTQMLAVLGQAAGRATNAAQIRFRHELYTAESGALHRETTGNDHVNDLVHAVFADSKGRVFVGTANGLAVYDGKQWTNTTFKMKGLSLPERAVLGVMRSMLSISKCGPEQIAEGPPGTIWLGGGRCGVWRFREGRYDEISPSPLGSDYLGMAVDKGGSLWVVTRDCVQKYDGHTWCEVLSPYIARTVHRELPQLYGMVVDTNGSVWIGGTVYGNPQPPWQHDGAVWVVDQGKRKRADGPPMAGLYEFDGKGWRAFGPPHGLGMLPRDTVIPKLDGQGRVTVNTHTGYFIRDGKSWTRVEELDAHAGRRWVLRAVRPSRPSGYFTELLYRDGDRFVAVQPIDQQTGAVLDLGSEPLRVLRMAEEPNQGWIWLGTMHGLYRIWLEK